ncbi:MAG TPA: hypothetical protein VES40_10450, partial [Ilumatobacteraceae bacterium]|nr:hypothetical protein [Ilumatobacteraceae bacterium]
ENDRDVAERTQADTEFLAREIAGVRLALSDMVTGEALDNKLEHLTKVVERLAEQVAQLTVVGAASDRSEPADQGLTDSP